MSIGELKQENEIMQQDINNLTYQLAKMKEENERLKLRNEMLELINFHLIRKEYKNEKNNFGC